MKKTIYILAIIGLLFGACDKIEEPYLVPIGTSGENKITINTEFLNDLSGSYNINVFIIESDIVSAQLNDEASIGPSPNWLDYQHNNMLRASITGTWGFGLAENPTSGMIVTNEYSFGLEDGWDPDNISFVVFVTNNEDFAILQAAEQSLKGKSVKADGKVAMLEEFTGHVCVNCPEATMLAHDLKEKYGENLVLLAIHAGDLSLPEEAPYDADYRTTTGTTIFNEFQPIGVPTGLVNRVQYNGGYVLFKDSWEAAIQEQLNLPQDVSIEIIVEVAE